MKVHIINLDVIATAKQFAFEFAKIFDLRTWAWLLERRERPEGRVTQPSSPKKQGEPVGTPRYELHCVVGSLKGQGLQGVKGRKNNLAL